MGIIFYTMNVISLHYNFTRLTLTYIQFGCHRHTIRTNEWIQFKKRQKPSKSKNAEISNNYFSALASALLCLFRAWERKYQLFREIFIGKRIERTQCDAIERRKTKMNENNNKQNFSQLAISLRLVATGVSVNDHRHSFAHIEHIRPHERFTPRQPN